MLWVMVSFSSRLLMVRVLSMTVVGLLSLAVALRR